MAFFNIDGAREKVSGAVGGVLDQAVSSIGNPAEDRLAQSQRQPLGFGSFIQQQGAAAFDPGASFNRTLGQSDPFDQVDGFRQMRLASARAAESSGLAAGREAAAALAGTRMPSALPNTGGGGGLDFGGPATADDNAGLTGAQIDQFIASKFANSPLAGQGEQILATANQFGISVPLLLGIAWKESGMGTNVGVGNIFGITDPSRDGGLGGQRAFQHYGSAIEEVQAAARLLSSGTYKGKSAADQLSMWYVGSPYSQSANADDKAGNGTVNDYLNNFIAPSYAALGRPFQPTAAPTQRAPAGGNSGQAGSMAGITPGVGGTVMQEFGPTEYAQAHPSTYAYGNAYGLAGSQHPGVDWAVPRGTRVATPLGGTVSVVGNDHGSGYYYTDTTGGGARDGAGEYAVTLDNGDILILGHMSRIDVQVGQRINAGDFIGLSGGSDGDHVHVEIRQRQPDGSYRIVDPRTYLK